VCNPVNADPVEVMARALAVMSGYSEGLNARSMLNSMDGFQTLLFKSSTAIRSPYYVWNALKGALTVDTVSAVRGMTITEDEMGAVFDMPVDKMAEVCRVRVCVCVCSRRVVVVIFLWYAVMIRSRQPAKLVAFPSKYPKRCHR
jgi:hypothetical protein